MLFNNLMIATLCLLLISAKVRAQEPVDSLTDALADHLVRQLEESGEDDDQLEAIRDRLAGYLQHPLNLNRASSAELKELGLLNDLQIIALQDHIRRTGPLVDLLELQSIAHFDLPLVKLLLPFVSIAPAAPFAPLSLKSILDRPEQELTLYYSRNFDPKNSTAAGDGNNYRIRLRYRFSHKDRFKLHFLADKDPGEAFLNSDPAKGFDFYSGNLFIQPSGGVLEKLVLGDYLLQFGQGLALWNGFSLGKGPAALNIARQAAGLKAHRSAGEVDFFRGAGATFHLGSFRLSSFFSSRRKDATLANFNGETAISAIRRTGLHRSKGELAARKTLRETMGGLHLDYEPAETIAIGLTAARFSLDKPLLPGKALYQRYRFSGSSGNILSLDYRMGKQNYFLFGEIARSRQPAWAGSEAKQGWGFSQGLLISPAKRVILALSGRWFSRSYESRYASPLAESSNPSGERGLYLGLECRLSPEWTINAYADAFAYSWLRYRVDAPSRGYETMLRLTFRPKKALSCYVRYRVTRKPRNIQVKDQPLRLLSDIRQQNARLHGELKLNRKLRLRSRVDVNIYQRAWPPQPAEKGWSFYQDIAWTTGKFRFSARVTFFKTDNYDTRIYSYESGILNGSSLVFYYGKGRKGYLGVRWKASPKIDLRLWGAQGAYRRENNATPDGAFQREVDFRLELKMKL